MTVYSESTREALKYIADVYEKTSWKVEELPIDYRTRIGYLLSAGFIITSQSHKSKSLNGYTISKQGSYYVKKYLSGEKFLKHQPTRLNLPFKKTIQHMGRWLPIYLGEIKTVVNSLDVSILSSKDIDWAVRNKPELAPVLANKTPKSRRQIVTSTFKMMPWAEQISDDVPPKFMLNLEDMEIYEMGV